MQFASKFLLGQLAATPGALEAMEASGQTAEFFLARHASGDWREVNEEDRQLNDEALIHLAVDLLRRLAVPGVNVV